VIGELQELGANIGKVNEVDESLVMKTSLEKAAGGFQNLDNLLRINIWRKMILENL